MTKANTKSYTCSCCNTEFTNKKQCESHEKKCTRMEGIEGSKGIKKISKPLPKAIRYALWNSVFGERVGSGPCSCCEREITQQTFEAGHVVAQSRGGSDSISNLRPICGPCNRSMGSTNMDEYIGRFKVL